MDEPGTLTRWARVFLTPANATHRQYEALRAYFVDGLPGTEVAARFGYTAGSFRVLAHQFRRQPDRRFFAAPATKTRGGRPDPVRQRIVALRKQNHSIYDIRDSLTTEGIRRSAVAVAEVLRKEGFAPLPRRRDEERPSGVRPTVADRADVGELSLHPRSLRTKFGGLFLFLPALAAIPFDRLVRRSARLLREIAATPPSAWRRIELEGISRIYRTPRILDREILLPRYRGPIRQVTILDLGHEEPTLLLTNQRRRSAAPLIERYARRMLIENNIEDAVNFFHIDALSSAVAMKVNCDLQLTLMASSLYRHLAQRIGDGHETAKSQSLFRNFVDATARVTVGSEEIVVQFQRRAHNPLLLRAGFGDTDIPIPWLGRKRLRFVFG